MRTRKIENDIKKVKGLISDIYSHYNFVDKRPFILLESTLNDLLRDRVIDEEMSKNE